MATKNMSVRLEEEPLDRFNAVLDECGIDFSTAVRMFVRRAAASQGLQDLSEKG